MEYKTILVAQKDHIATLYLNRPEVLNALSDDMRCELIHFFRDAADDPNLRALIVTGKGRAFSAGADLNLFKMRYETYRREGQLDGSFRKWLPQALLAFPKPIIAAINGLAVGFGATMPLNCDIRIASTEAKFSFPFARLGVTPEFCSSYFLPRLIGLGQAAELVYTAKMIDAQEALRIGLVNRVLPPEELLPVAEKMAQQIAQMAPSAIRTAKRLFEHGMQSSKEQMLEHETLELQRAMQSEAHYEAVCRMLETMNTKNK
jgi:enoyl-CoA hydratase/carnithine racemase